MRLYLIRHGQSLWNAEVRVQGQEDVPLGDLGHQQAKLVANRLAGRQIGAVYSSDLCRCLGTAAPIAAALGLAVTAAPQLRERNLGEFQGLVWDEITARYADVWHTAFRTLDGKPPGGESRREVGERVGSLLDTISADPPDDEVVLVGHGGSLRAAIVHLLRLSHEMAWNFHFDNCGLSVVDVYPEGAVIQVLNDVCHLDGHRSPTW